MSGVVLPFAQKYGDNIYRKLAMHPPGKVIHVEKEFAGKQSPANDQINQSITKSQVNPTNPYGRTQTINYIKRELTIKVF